MILEKMLRAKAKKEVKSGVGESMKEMARVWKVYGMLMEKGRLIRKVYMRMRRHIYVRNTFVKEFLKEWNGKVMDEIQKEYKEKNSRHVMSSKIFTRVPARVIKRLALCVFDIKLKQKMPGGKISKLRDDWFATALAEGAARKKLNRKESNYEVNLLADLQPKTSLRRGKESLQKQASGTTSSLQISSFAEKDRSSSRSPSPEQRGLKTTATSRSISPRRDPQQAQAPAYNRMNSPLISNRRRNDRSFILQTYTAETDLKSPFRSLKPRSRMRVLLLAIRYAMRSHFITLRKNETVRDLIKRKLKKKPRECLKVKSSIPQDEFNEYMRILTNFIYINPSVLY